MDKIGKFIRDISPLIGLLLAGVVWWTTTDAKLAEHDKSILKNTEDHKVYDQRFETLWRIEVQLQSMKSDLEEIKKTLPRRYGTTE